MCDLETTSTDPGHGGIIEIAAVQFDLLTGQIGSQFNACLWLPTNRFWDEDTRTWWSEQRPEILTSIFDRAQDPAQVIASFVAWCRGLTMVGDLRMWSKPISFDFPFLASYFRQYGYANPFHFRDAIDMQSYIRGMRRDPAAKAFDKEVPFEGTAHSAIDDTYHQVKVVLTAKELFA